MSEHAYTPEHPQHLCPTSRARLEEFAREFEMRERQIAEAWTSLYHEETTTPEQRRQYGRAVGLYDRALVTIVPEVVQIIGRPAPEVEYHVGRDLEASRSLRALVRSAR